MVIKNRKGIILAGGSGTRLLPSTKSVSKQILTIYDKPMIFYALSVLMLSNIREILIISTPRDIIFFEILFGDGAYLGLSISYKIQHAPNGIAESFILGEEFIGSDHCALILGDNMFYGNDLSSILKNASSKVNSSIFVYQVKDPSSYGVIELDENNNILGIEEKPKVPKSNLAVTGLYFYDNEVIEVAKNLIPSLRGELEITDINNYYINIKKMSVEYLRRGHTWLDMGTHDSLLEASNYVSTLQKRQGVLISSPEEIAFLNKWISIEQLEELIHSYGNNQYAQYLKKYLL